MLTSMREAIDRRGGLAAIATEADPREAVLAGALQRLRPKLLTEGVIVLSLLPMLWATGVGAEILRPMAAPVLGGILIADKVVDLSVPALFYWLRLSRWRAARSVRGGESGAQPELAPGGKGRAS
jgi:Cu(I)/Ag(I) efflux system membrane protein CusA/SilA